MPSGLAAVWIPSRSATVPNPNSSAKAKAPARSLIGPHGTPDFGQHPLPVGGRLLNELRLKLGAQVLAMKHALRIRGEACVPDQVRASDGST